MNAHYTTSGTPVNDRIPEMPKDVKLTVSYKLLSSLDKVFYDALGDYWYIPHWKGMYVGIERDGYAHT